MEEKAHPEYALPIGFTLANGQYRLEKVLGSGGYGITYLAWDNGRNMRVALKELYPRNEVVRDKDTKFISANKGSQESFEYLKERFSQEANILYSMQKVPKVMKVYHLFEEYGTVYYAMEYLEGEDLGKHLKKNGKMSWSQLQKPIWMLLQSLEALHNNGLLHRDISPDNIFLLKNGEVRLIDFGSVRSIHSDHYTTIFKSHFAPPELWTSHGNQGPWSDLFSLSVTLYYALTGILPPQSPDRLSNLLLNNKDSAKPLASLNPNAPIYVQQAIEKGMSPDKEKRYQDARTFMYALYPASNNTTFMPSPSVKIHPIPPVPKVPHTNASVASLRVVCVSGMNRGKECMLNPGCVVEIGRRHDAQISYPDNQRMISRHQCSFMMDNKGLVYVQDGQSANGTFLNGMKLPPKQWVVIRKNQSIVFVNEVYQLK